MSSGNPPYTCYCSFCGKSQFDVECLIAGPTVFICGECVALCCNIVKHKHAVSHGLEEYLDGPDWSDYDRLCGVAIHDYGDPYIVITEHDVQTTTAFDNMPDSFLT